MNYTLLSDAKLKKRTLVLGLALSLVATPLVLSLRPQHSAFANESVANTEETPKNIVYYVNLISEKYPYFKETRHHDLLEQAVTAVINHFGEANTDYNKIMFMVVNDMSDYTNVKQDISDLLFYRVQVLNPKDQATMGLFSFNELNQPADVFITNYLHRLELAKSVNHTGMEATRSYRDALNSINEASSELPPQKIEELKANLLQAYNASFSKDVMNQLLNSDGIITDQAEMLIQEKMKIFNEKLEAIQAQLNVEETHEPTDAVSKNTTPVSNEAITNESKSQRESNAENKTPSPKKVTTKVEARKTLPATADPSSSLIALTATISAGILFVLRKLVANN